MATVYAEAVGFLRVACPPIILLGTENREIYLDLDGVLADFDKEIDNIYSGNRPKEIKEDEWSFIKELAPELYLHLEKMPSANRLVNSLRILGFEPKILTAIPKRILWPEVVAHKRAWVQDNFGNLEVYFGPYAVDKQYFCKPGHILIDDMLINIQQWHSKGGYGWVYKDPLCKGF